MFQNIARDFIEENGQASSEQNENQNKKSVKEIIKNLFCIQNIILYTISFLISMNNLYRSVDGDYIESVGCF